MSYTWFKLHHDLPGDIKLRRFTPQEKWAWVALLCLASQSRNRGVIDADDEDIADYCEFSTSQDWLYYRDKLIAKGMIEIGPDGNLHIVHWEQRQYDKPSDRPEAVKERVKKHRAKKKQAQKQGDETLCNALQTPSNANVTPQIRKEEIREEEIREENTPLPPKGECKGEGEESNFSNPEPEPTKQGTVNAPRPVVDPTAATFWEKPWRGEDHQLSPAFCEYVGNLFPGDSNNHPRTKGRNHIINLERSGDPSNFEKLNGYWDDYNQPEESAPDADEDNPLRYMFAMARNVGRTA